MIILKSWPIGFLSLEVLRKLHSQVTWQKGKDLDLVELDSSLGPTFFK